jgi:hypothetical protein
MKEILIFIVSLLFIVGCSSTDRKFCDCLKASKAFNQINSEVLSGERSQNKIKEAKELLKEKSKLCADYKNMVGEELTNKKRACE